MSDFYKESIKLHKQQKGKIEIQNKFAVSTAEELSKVYSPGVAGPCLEIEKHP